KPAVTALPPAAAEQFIGAPAEAAEQNFLVTQDDSSSGTPEVTDVTVRSEPPPENAPQPERKTPESGTRAKGKTSPAPPARPPGRSPAQVTQPPVMAAQPQPAQKEPPPPAKSEDTASQAPFVAIEKEARIIRLEKPKISNDRFLGGVTGQVVVQVRIDATGKPVQTVTLKSTNDMLIQPVIDAIMTSQFAPAEMTTGPVASWLTIPFRFATK
ncbi:MAG TPA: energy transducer TonB, partial [Bacteroidota bacterium]|nr:energy transducer TonB [Bacteroidota bacterium]